MKRIALGILAHVDSGKTTLSESILYNSGSITKQGRVDHGDAFLDTEKIEKDRGITIYTKQAIMEMSDAKITIVDTPGHVDFSAETERALCVLDYCILVISATDKVQSHTHTLWKLLSHYKIPCFIFINKTDLPNEGKETIMADITSNLSEGCLDFSNMDEDFYELAALQDSELMEHFLESGSLDEEMLSRSIGARNIFPCFFGSALKNEGVNELMDAIRKYTRSHPTPDLFGARVFKISEDEKGNLLTHMKITGGSLKVKTPLDIKGNKEKINEIRLYSGNKYISANEVYAGDVCAVTGISSLSPGDGIGIDEGEERFYTEPVFSYGVRLPEGTDVIRSLPVFRKLEQEDPRLKVSVSGKPQKINICVMGEIQLEILKRVLSDRFSLDVEFEEGTILYKESIKDTVEGVGHYEPLRHYSEVHLLIEPGKRDSGLTFFSKCSEDVLARNWQRLIMTHLEEKTHLGVLTGSPLTDVKITLINGRAHQKHTDGGDFRQATYRAVRQGLMQAESVILEPYCSFVLEIPTPSVGKALTDFQQMGADFESPISLGDVTRIKGKAPFSAMRDYHKEVISYTRGMGRLNLSYSGYEECKNPDDIIESAGYNPTADTENTPDSVFCSHGSGYTVPWDKVFEHMHIPLLKNQEDEYVPVTVRRNYEKIIADESELLKIFEQVYGKREKLQKKNYAAEKTSKTYRGDKRAIGPEYLLVDGYNIIFASDELKEISKDTPDAARNVLINRLCNYQAMKGNNIILVFDAYKVKGNVREIENIGKISVVYTKEAETADTYIEKTSRELAKNYRVRVATSDALEQMIVFGSGAVRVSAREFLEELSMAEKEMRRFISENV